MFSKFIQRPVLAIALSLATVFLGILAINTRPISQFPDIAPPRVNIFIAYPGSSARVLVESTLIPLERAINGVQGMQYITSDATSAGEATIQIIFEPGTDPNAAVVNVKTRVDAIMNNLPPLVQREGIIITPIQPSMLMYVNLFSKDKNADEKFLYNYANVNIIPELQRISGMGRSDPRKPNLCNAYLVKAGSHACLQRFNRGGYESHGRAEYHRPSGASWASLG